jgi:hypothetical protein
MGRSGFFTAARSVGRFATKVASGVQTAYNVVKPIAQTAATVGAIAAL